MKKEAKNIWNIIEEIDDSIDNAKLIFNEIAVRNEVTKSDVELLQTILGKCKERAGKLYKFVGKDLDEE